MNTSSKLFIAGLVLTATAFAQEPKRAIVPQETIAEAGISTELVITAGVPQRRAPMVPPKALPPLHPSLGEIARLARAAHAEAPKAQMVVADDALAQHRTQDK